MAKQKTVWVCIECGHEEVKWAGTCSACKRWNTLEEVLGVAKKQQERFIAKTAREEKPILLNSVGIKAEPRMATGFPEVDRLLGGGLVPGSLLLLGGDPGIGKSTLLLQLASHLATKQHTVLYISGEESSKQTAMRASRLGISTEGLYVFSETSFSTIKREIDLLKPDILIIDSVQIIYKDEIPSAPGSVTQLREVTMEAMHLAKGQGITTFLIGHVTKTGEIAGPKVLEHMVDTVLEFEGNQEMGFRTLRSIKNRFGPTDEVAIFQMEEKGLKELLSPSLVFLGERVKATSGAVTFPTMEGSRAIVIEVQALISKSAYQNPSRRSTGIDPNRLALLLAVLEKRMRYQLYTMDVFVSIVGGMKILEPASDLALLLAITSSFCHRPLQDSMTVMGEVGLGGEVRSVPRCEQRLKEAIHMGFEEAIIPIRNLKGMPQEITKKIKLHGVQSVDEAIKIAFP